MNKYLIAGSLCFTLFCSGMGFLAYQKITRLDLSTPISDLQSQSEERIKLLEDGLAIQQQNLKECRATILYNKREYEDYVRKTSNYVSKANDRISFVEGKVLQATQRSTRATEDNKRLLEALQERDERIQELYSYIRELQNEEAER